jgi:hypothetical protein
VSTAPVLTSNGHSDPPSNLLIAVQHMLEEHPASMIDTLSKPGYTHPHRASGGTACTVRGFAQACRSKLALQEFRGSLWT